MTHPNPERVRLRLKRDRIGSHYGPAPIDVHAGQLATADATSWARARTNARGHSGPLHVVFDDGQRATCLYGSDFEEADTST